MLDLWEPMIRILTLATAANTLWPEMLPMPKAIEHAAAAVKHGDAHGVEAELALAIARCETRFISIDVSRHNGKTGKQETSKWPSQTRGPSFTAPYFCGVMQSKSNTWFGCLDLRTIDWAYESGITEIDEWLDDSRCFGDAACAAAGHGNGNNGVDRYLHPTSHAARVERRRLARKPRTSEAPGWCDKTVPYYERVIEQRDRLHAIVVDLSQPKPVAPSLAFE